MKRGEAVGRRGRPGKADTANTLCNNVHEHVV